MPDLPHPFQKARWALGFSSCGTSGHVSVGVGVYVPGGWVGAGPYGAYPPTVIGRPPVYY
ncbi:MAG: hypothetical protein KAJ12_07755 [Bacteroidetes bacterium]|nr:hypothetical protein [Bacteroidota bacterium]